MKAAADLATDLAIQLPFTYVNIPNTISQMSSTGTVSALLREGCLATDSPCGPVRFAAPGKALRFYLPALWPEAEQDHAAADAAPAP